MSSSSFLTNDESLFWQTNYKCKSRGRAFIHLLILFPLRIRKTTYIYYFSKYVIANNLHSHFFMIMHFFSEIFLSLHIMVGIVVKEQLGSIRILSVVLKIIIFTWLICKYVQLNCQYRSDRSTVLLTVTRMWGFWKLWTSFFIN